MLNFAGKIASFTAEPGTLSAEQIGALYAAPRFPAGGIRERRPGLAGAGSRLGGLPEARGQDPWTLPKSNAAPAPARWPSTASPTSHRSIRPDDAWAWEAWSLVEAPKTRPAGAEISTPASTPMVIGHRARHGADHPDRPRRLSRPRLRPQQPGDPGIAQRAGLLVSQRSSSRPPALDGPASRR